MTRTADRFSAIEKALTMLAAGLPHPPVARATLELYAEQLAHVDPLLLEAAVLKLINGMKFFPALCEIRDAIDSLTPDGHVDPELVWTEVRNAIIECGYLRTPTFADPLIGRAVEAVGWRTICDATSDEIPSHRSRLIDAYRRLVQREREARMMSPQVKALVAQVLARKAIGS